VNLCEFLNGTLKHPLFDLIFGKLIESFSRDLIHPCPYSGEFKAFNKTYTFPSFMHVGVYRVFFHYFDEEDDHIFGFRYDFRINDVRQAKKKN
jgi:hypothetical protein